MALAAGRWPLAGLAGSAVGVCLMPRDQLSWYVPVALLLVAFLAWQARRESLANRPPDPAALQARLTRVLTLVSQDRIDAAIAELDTLIPDLQRAAGPNHQATLSARTLHLRLRGERGDLPDRVVAMDQLIEELQGILGADHEETLAARYQLADWIGEEDGYTDEARETFESLIADATRVLGAEHSIPPISRSSLTILRFRSGDQAAYADLAVIADDMERALGPADPTTVSTRNLLSQWDPATS